MRGTLPWLLNGTLGDDERRQVLQHLATCETCRRELAETRQAAEIFDQHPPSEAIVALAWDETPRIDPVLLEEHLAACPLCAAELELARTSRRLEEDEKIVPLARRAAAPAPAQSREGWRGWRAAALAAGLAGVVAFSGWFQSAGRVQTLEENLASRTAAPATVPPAATGEGATVRGATVQQLSAEVEERNRRIEQLEAKLDEVEQQATELSGQVDQLARARPAAPSQSPQINVWARALVPAADVARGNAAEPMEVPGRTWATLLLASAHQPETHREHVVEIEDDSGTVVWNANGLALDPETRGYSLTLPPGTLRAGGYTIRVYGLTDGRRELTESYPIRVR